MGIEGVGFRETPEQARQRRYLAAHRPKTVRELRLEEAIAAYEIREMLERECQPKEKE